MKRMLQVVGVVALVFVAGCSGISVSTDYDPGVDFASFSTYNWMKETTKGTYNSEGLVDDRIKEAVDTELTAKGFKKVASDPQLLAVYHVGAQSEVEVDDWGYGFWGAGGVSAYTYEEGTLIVDLVDAKTMKLVWRGTAEGALPQNPSASEQTEGIDSAVEQMFAKYPPKTKS